MQSIKNLGIEQKLHKYRKLVEQQLLEKTPEEVIQITQTHPCAQFN